MGIDYGKELEELKKNESMTWFKPNPGKHDIKIIEEPVDKLYENPDTGEKTEQVEMPIEVNGEKLMWTVGKGKSTESLYGQLVKLGSMNGNKLKDVTFELRVTKTGVMPSGGIKRKYEIPVVQDIGEENVK